MIVCYKQSYIFIRNHSHVTEIAEGFKLQNSSLSSYTDRPLLIA